MYYGVNVITHDLTLIKEAFAYRKLVIQNSQVRYNIFKSLQDLPINGNNFEKLIRTLENFWNQTDNETVFSMSGCLEALEVILNDPELEFVQAKPYPSMWFNTLMLGSKYYNNAASLMFRDTGIVGDNKKEHTDCLLQFQKTNESLFVIFEISQLTYAFVDNYYEINELSLSDLARPIRHVLDEFDVEEVINVLNDNGEEKCNWIYELSTPPAEPKKLELAMDSLYQAKLLQIQCSQWMSDMSNYVLKATVYHELFIEPLIMYVDQYQNKVIRMENFSNAWKPDFVAEVSRDYSTMLTDLKLVQIEYDRTCRQLPTKLNSVFSYMWDYPIPALNYSTLFATQLWTELIAKSNASIMSELRQHIESKPEWPPDLSTLIDQLYLPFLDYPQEMETTNTEAFLQFTNAVQDTKIPLAEFEMGTQIDEKFFL
jgi:hypothetical protein